MKSAASNYIVFLLLAAFIVSVLGYFSYGKYQDSKQRGKIAAESHEQLKNAIALRDEIEKIYSANRSFRSSQKEADRKQVKEYQAKSGDLISRMIAATSINPNRYALAVKLEKDFEDFNSALSARSMDRVKESRDALLKSTDQFIQSEDVNFREKLSNLIQLNRSFYLTVMLSTYIAFAALIYMNYVLMKMQSRGAGLEKKIVDLHEKQTRSFRATKDGFFEWELQNKKIYWSPRLVEMIGYNDGELAPSAELLEQMMHPDDREGYWSDLHRHLRGETPEHSAIFRWKHKAGNWVWVHARGRADFNEFGDPTKLIGVHTDVSELKENEMLLSRAKDEAERANRIKSDFMAHMSHEIRTPLTAITGVAEILSMQAAGFDDKAKRLVNALNTSAITLRDLITDILDFSKIETGRITLAQDEIDIYELIGKVTENFADKAAEKGLSISLDAEMVKGMVMMGDAARVRQILVNVIGNAVKFTVQGDVTVKAEVISKDLEAVIRISVLDTGVGISEAQMPYIFDSFRQADGSNSRKFGGTGLGLPISLKLAQLMGGAINVVSEEDIGSLFIIELPLTRSENKIESADTKLEENFTLPIAINDRILIVEDYEGNIAFITHILDEMGIKYDLGRNGVEGVKHWQSNTYRLVLMDIQMPEMDGIAAVKAIREAENADPQKIRTPIIAMTAHAFSEDREKCMAEGFDEYLQKPLTKHSLYVTIKKLLG